MRVWLASLALLASPVLAQECHFTLECFEAEACAETDYSFTLEPGDTGPDTMRMVTPSETLDGSVYQGDFGFVFVAHTVEATHLVSANPDSDARYSVHLQGPLVVTYLGRCEAGQ